MTTESTETIQRETLRNWVITLMIRESKNNPDVWIRSRCDTFVSLRDASNGPNVISIMDSNVRVSFIRDDYGSITNVMTFPQFIDHLLFGNIT